MRYTLKILTSFLRAAKPLRKKYPSLAQDIRELSQQLLLNPDQGADLGNGIRKIRMSIASKGRGKSGGARVITYNLVVSVEETQINLLFIYDKAERSSISKTEIQKLINELEIHG